MLNSNNWVGFKEAQDDRETVSGGFGTRAVLVG